MPFRPNDSGRRYHVFPSGNKRDVVSAPDLMVNRIEVWSSLVGDAVQYIQSGLRSPGVVSLRCISVFQHYKFFTKDNFHKVV